MRKRGESRWSLASVFSRNPFFTSSHLRFPSKPFPFPSTTLFLSSPLLRMLNICSCPGVSRRLLEPTKTSQRHVFECSWFVLSYLFESFKACLKWKCVGSRCNTTSFEATGKGVAMVQPEISNTSYFGRRVKATSKPCERLMRWRLRKSCESAQITASVGCRSSVNRNQSMDSCISHLKVASN